MGWFYLAILALAGTVQSQETCLSGEEYPYLMFGTKTAYTFVTSAKPNSRAHDVIGCSPIAFWLLNRHGSHNPEADEIAQLQRLQDFRDNIVSNYRAGNYRNTNQRICASDLNILERWAWNPRQNVTFAGTITSDGYITTQQLAQSWKQKYPGLLSDNRHDYLFTYSHDKKATTTFNAFVEGLFRTQADGYDIPKRNGEQLLKPFQSCPKWRNDIEKNNDTISQVHIFESKQEYKDMVHNISLRLGFSYDIDAITVKRMYQMCRYNKAWDVVQISPWCAAFTREELRRLEYVEDLETYYKYGYGSSLNQQLGCGLVKDMMDFFTKQIQFPDTPQQPQVMVNFVDAPTLLLMHTALGAHKGVTPLTSDNYRTQSQSRKWTTSTMSPFNGNLAAVLYRCNINDNYQVQEKFQVLFLENEQQLNLDGCRVGLCNWSLVQQKFGNVAQNCDTAKLCSAAASLASVAALAVVASLLVKLLS